MDTLQLASYHCSPPPSPRRGLRAVLDELRTTNTSGFASAENWVQSTEWKSVGLDLDLVGLLNAGNREFNDDRSEGCVVSVAGGRFDEKCP